MLDDGKLVKLSFMVDKFNVLLITLFNDEKSNCLCCWSKVDELFDESSIIEFNGINSLLIMDEEDDEDKFMFAVVELVCPVAVIVVVEVPVVVVGTAVLAPPVELEAVLSSDSVGSMPKC